MASFSFFLSRTPKPPNQSEPSLPACANRTWFVLPNSVEYETRCLRGSLDNPPEVPIQMEPARSSYKGPTDGWASPLFFPIDVMFPRSRTKSPFPSAIQINPSRSRIIEEIRRGRFVIPECSRVSTDPDARYRNATEPSPERPSGVAPSRSPSGVKKRPLALWIGTIRFDSP